MFEFLKRLFKKKPTVTELAVEEPRKKLERVPRPAGENKPVYVGSKVEMRVGTKRSTPVRSTPTPREETLRRSDYSTSGGMDLLDPLNPLSPISPLNPLNPLGIMNIESAGAEHGLNSHDVGIDPSPSPSYDPSPSFDSSPSYDSSPSDSSSYDSGSSYDSSSSSYDSGSSFDSSSW